MFKIPTRSWIERKIHFLYVSRNNLKKPQLSCPSADYFTYYDDPSTFVSVVCVILICG